MTGKFCSFSLYLFLNGINRWIQIKEYCYSKTHTIIIHHTNIFFKPFQSQSTPKILNTCTFKYHKKSKLSNLMNLSLPGCHLFLLLLLQFRLLFLGVLIRRPGKRVMLIVITFIQTVPLPIQSLLFRLPILTILLWLKFWPSSLWNENGFYYIL